MAGTLHHSLENLELWRHRLRRSDATDDLTKVGELLVPGYSGFNVLAWTAGLE